MPQINQVKLIYGFIKKGALISSLPQVSLRARNVRGV